MQHVRFIKAPRVECLRRQVFFKRQVQKTVQVLTARLQQASFLFHERQEIARQVVGLALRFAVGVAKNVFQLVF